MKRKYINGVPVLLALMIMSSNTALAENSGQYLSGTGF